MPFAIGILLFALGVVTVVGWWDAVLPFLKGITAFSLLFWGLIAIIVGYSERRARREFGRAMNDKPVDETRPAETS